jgi:hypothetical protein
MSQEVMPRLSRRARAWLSALGALSAAATIVLMCHPRWDYPASTGLMAAVLVVVAFGRLFEQSWTYVLGVCGVLAAVLVGFFELALGSGGLLPAFVLLAILFSLGGRWSHYQWLRRPRVACPPAKEEERGEEAGPREERLPAGRSLHDLRPRSRTALLHACACLSAAAVLFGLGRQTGDPWLTAAVTMPEIILAVGLWLHADWVRWFGPLVCVAWAGFLGWFLFQPEFEGLWVVKLLPIVLLRLAWTFRQWKWETPGAW